MGARQRAVTPDNTRETKLPELALGRRSERAPCNIQGALAQTRLRATAKREKA